MAGGMIREMEDVWETELVPLLKEGLSGELSVEQRIVKASLKCVDDSQRAGVEALFTVFGCFAEDEVVPAVAIDLLAPAIQKRMPARGQTAGSVSLLHVRKWLLLLLRNSVLSGSVVKGVSAHGRLLHGDRSGPCPRVVSSVTGSSDYSLQGDRQASSNARVRMRRSRSRRPGGTSCCDGGRDGRAAARGAGPFPGGVRRQ
jgi:hypothetical protein